MSWLGAQLNEVARKAGHTSVAAMEMDGTQFARCRNYRQLSRALEDLLDTNTQSRTRRTYAQCARKVELEHDSLVTSISGSDAS